jgi:peptidoglycan-associated lipoprotein
MLAGGGVDIGLSRHIALRLVQADYVRIQLPNSITNVQNNFRLGAGIILH